MGFVAIKAGKYPVQGVVVRGNSHSFSGAVVFAVFVAGADPVAAFAVPVNLDKVSAQGGAPNGVGGVMTLSAEGVVIRGQGAICRGGSPWFVGVDGIIVARSLVGIADAIHSFAGIGSPEVVVVGRFGQNGKGWILHIGLVTFHQVGIMAAGTGVGVGGEIAAEFCFGKKPYVVEIMVGMLVECLKYSQG